MDEEQPTAPSTTARNLKIALAAGIALVAVVAVGFASTGGRTQWSDDLDTGSSPAIATATIATSAPSPTPTARPADTTNAIRGVIQSRAEAVLSSRITAKIVSMPFRPGQSFRQGTVLVDFDCSALRAQFAAANAATAAYRKAFETNTELDAYQAVGKNDVEISKANFNKATAEAGVVNAQMKDCAIRAPFNGIVVDQTAHAHEVAASGQPLMKIQNSGDLEIEVIVPSGWLTWLKPGTPFSFRVDETGDTVKASVTRLGASVDPVSKTLRVTGSISGGARVILPGMSGTATFDQAAGEQAARRGNTT